MVAKYLTPTNRRWAYGIGTAVTAFLGVKGLLSKEESDGINLILAAVLGMAYINTPSGKDA